MSPPLSGLMPRSKTSVFTVTNRFNNLDSSEVSVGPFSIAITGKLSDSPNTPGAFFGLLFVCVGAAFVWVEATLGGSGAP